MEFVKKLSPNFTVGRANTPISVIVIHWIGEGTADSAASYFSKTSSKVSAHYIIGNNKSYQCVEEKDTAWHAGDWNMNLKSIGIEHEATPNIPATDTIYQRSADLVAQLAKKYNIPLDRKHIIGHKEVKATACPGTINIDKIITMAKGEIDSELDKIKKELATALSEKDRYKKERNECRDSRLLEKEEYNKALAAKTVAFDTYKEKVTNEVINLQNSITDYRADITTKDELIKKLKLPIKMLTISDFIKIKFGK